MAFHPTALRHHKVIARTGMTLIAEAADIAVDAEFTFDSRDPFAVRVVFRVAPSSAVEWVFSRELLVDGLSGPAGTGDVQIFPCDDGIVLELNSPSGQARLLADPQILLGFTQDTLDVVPLGTEARYFNLDHEIGLLADLPLPGTPQS